jgi:hypothetical protein
LRIPNIPAQRLWILVRDHRPGIDIEFGGENIADMSLL